MQQAAAGEQIGAGPPQLARGAAAQHESPAPPVAVVEHLHRIEHRRRRLRLVDEDYVRFGGGRERLAFAAKEAGAGEQAAPLLRVSQVVMERRLRQQVGQEGRLAGLPGAEQDMDERLAQLFAEPALDPPIEHVPL